ncbi:MAG: NRDE family protein [Verrucomicrobia bacterium]|nr:NRDE family protein [Verrucomicrobiota bacterium]MDA1088013.1 NRDE family protein [Verrucomicrobiota bacterium]
MCTVTWLRSTTGYELFCNRDETLTRPAAEPPAHYETNSIRYIAPIDPCGGGTWIGTNQSGLTLCMLNFYADGVLYAPADRQSRGRLLTALLANPTPEAAVDTARGTPLEHYPPFLLLAISGTGPVRNLTWDGESAVVGQWADSEQPVTTCSVDTERVLESRRETYRKLLQATPSPARSDLTSFHASHDPQASAYSVCTHRDDAETRSFSHVIVDEERIELRYAGCPPCRMSPADVVSTVIPRQ